MLTMADLAPIVALAAATLGWIMLAFEKRANAQLRRRLEAVEANTAAAAAAADQPRHNVPNSKEDAAATTTTAPPTAPSSLSRLPTTPNDIDSNDAEAMDKEIFDEIHRLRQELESKLLLDAEDVALQKLHQELMNIKSSFEEDVALPSSGSSVATTTEEDSTLISTLISTPAPLSGVQSGLSTPGTRTPPRYVTSAIEGAAGATQQPPPSLVRSSSLTPPTSNIKQRQQPSLERLATPSSTLATHKLALSASTSGATTPLTPQSPLHANNFIGAPLPPLPPMHVAPPQGFDAASMVALQSNNTTLEDSQENSDNDEEWLLKADEDDDDGEDEDTPVVVRPLPKVPKLALGCFNTANTHASGTFSARGGGPLTISARGGITGRPKTSRTATQQQTPRNHVNTVGARGANDGANTTTTSTTKRAKHSSSVSSAVKAGTTPRTRTTTSSTTTSTRQRTSPPTLGTAIAGSRNKNDAPTPRLINRPLALDLDAVGLGKNSNSSNFSGSLESARNRMGSGLPRSPLIISTGSGTGGGTGGDESGPLLTARSMQRSRIPKPTC